MNHDCDRWGCARTSPTQSFNYIAGSHKYVRDRVSVAIAEMLAMATSDTVSKETAERFFNTMPTNPDPSSYIQSSAQLLAKTLDSKNSDYRIGGEFSNFEQAAKFADIDVLEVMLAQIGIKFTRIQGLTGTASELRNESVKDSLLDLAGYAIIAHAYLESSDELDEF